MKHLFLLSLLFYCALCQAQNLQETRKMYSEGDFIAAKAGAQKLVESSPNNATYNQWYGACLFETGEYEASEKYLIIAASKQTEEADLYLGRLYYMWYEFEKASSHFESHLALLQKKGSTDDEITSTESLLKQAKRAGRLLTNTEDIQIIDSVVVDKNDFLSSYRLSAESGIVEKGRGDVRSVHTNQLQNKRYYDQLDSTGVYAIYSQQKLLDGWSDEVQLPEVINSLKGANGYPFMMTDGVTIYYASEGHESIGGYDIFVSRYNNNTDTYLTPEQLGMPFNSIYNDYMLAIDELSEIGYFATDRFQPEGKVVIYTFIPNEKKTRIEGENAILKNRAMITSIQDSWREEQGYATLLQHVQKYLSSDLNTKNHEFTLVINDERVYHTWSDFKSDAAKSLFMDAQRQKGQLDELNANLENNRLKYSKASANADPALRKTILELEQMQKEMHPKYRELIVQARNAEIKHLRIQQ